MEKDTFDRFMAPCFTITPSGPVSINQTGFLTASELDARKKDRMTFLLTYEPHLWNLRHTWEYFDEYPDYLKYFGNDRRRMLVAFKPGIDAFHRKKREEAAEKTRLQNLTK